jgi:imidazoleglycerol-phosphate dehydratase / histidinol-phosphatase
MSSGKRLLFIDRDGTLIVEPQPSMQIDSLEKLELLPNVIWSLSRISDELDFELVLVTNQDGLGTESFPESTFWPAHKKLMRLFETEGINFLKVHIDPSFEHENSPNRKPGTGMLKEYLSGEYDLQNSFVIGDRITDIQLAENLGAKAIFYSGSHNPRAVLTTKNWKDIYDFLRYPVRKAQVFRKTKETEVSISVNLDRPGNADIKTGIGFFDHMLEQLCFHGGFDLKIHVKGDLHIDEHHTVEDTAIALGEAFHNALGNKKGISRYGFLLPMDDCLAQVAIDFSGRPWLVWEAEFKREKIGDLPTELFFHFFKSFSDSAKCNLNIKAEGSNEHHKIEAIFKGFARAVKMAVKLDPDLAGMLPSTKGSL